MKNIKRSFCGPKQHFWDVLHIVLWLLPAKRCRRFLHNTSAHLISATIHVLGFTQPDLCTKQLWKIYDPHWPMLTIPESPAETLMKNFNCEKQLLRTFKHSTIIHSIMLCDSHSKIISNIFDVVVMANGLELRWPLKSHGIPATNRNFSMKKIVESSHVILLQCNVSKQRSGEGLWECHIWRTCRTSGVYILLVLWPPETQYSVCWPIWMRNSAVISWRR